MIKNSEYHELVQIDCAARGLVSGTLGEWPFLKNALRKRGIFLPDSTDAMELKRICAVWWEENMDLTSTKGGAHEPLP